MSERDAPDNAPRDGVRLDRIISGLEELGKLPPRAFAILAPKLSAVADDTGAYAALVERINAVNVAARRGEGLVGPG